MNWLLPCLLFLIIYVYPTATIRTSSSSIDNRVNILSAFLERYKSSMDAKELITASDKYGLDWRLLPAIAGVESTFCRNYIHNCFGWNKDKTPASPDRVARGIILEKPYAKWNKDRTNIYLLAVPYNYAHPEEWTKKVNFFMGKIK